MGVSIRPFLRSLHPGEDPTQGGELAAMLRFYRGDALLRKVWVREGGEWGIERPRASWTTGADPELWRLVTGGAPGLWQALRERLGR